MSNFGFGLFGIFFAIVFVLILGTFATSAFLGYQCYTSRDPNSIACYMISDRHEIGIRNR